jgi:hypothetical protein
MMQPSRRWDSEIWGVAGFAMCVSLLAFLYYFQRNQILLYGDAEGHINIARRVFDSRTPGLLQLGTVWLPLPHLLMIPFLMWNAIWKNATGGSIPSMIAYVFSAIGMFRLARVTLSGLAIGAEDAATTFAKRFGPWFAVLVFAGNPNLIYLQATAMTEPLYLAWFVWAVVHLVEFAQGVDARESLPAKKSLQKCALCLAACTMTRYDGWFAAGATTVAVVLIAIRARSQMQSDLTRKACIQRIARFLLVCAAGPVLWVAYNAIVYRNPLEFANGPYSAKAIERRIVQPPHPGNGDLAVAELYFIRAAEMNLSSRISVAKFWLLLAAMGTLIAVLAGRSGWVLLLLWIPLPFYALSVAYSGVPIFVPDWWPFGQYNLRYGLQVLPAVALFSAVAVTWILARISESRWRLALVSITTAFLLFECASSWKMPASLLEGTLNMQSRVELQEKLAVELGRLPSESSILMALRDFPGAPQRAGVALKRVINENDQRLWVRPSDPEGIWPRALQNPERFVDYAVGFAGDPVEASAQQNHLRPVLSIEVAGQPRATLYRVR